MHPRLALVILVLAGALAADAVGAREPASRLPDSVRRVERETGGQVLKAEPYRGARDGVNRVKVLTDDGRVRVLRDDPRAGAERAPHRGVGRQDSVRPRPAEPRGRAESRADGPDPHARRGQ